MSSTACPEPRAPLVGCCKFPFGCFDILYKGTGTKHSCLSRILEEEFTKREAMEKLKEQQAEELMAERKRREELEENFQVSLANRV